MQASRRGILLRLCLACRVRSFRRIVAMSSGWNPSGWFSSKTTDKQSKLEPKTRTEQWLAMYEERPADVRVVLVSALAAGSIATLVLVKLHTRFLRRYPTNEWITPNLYSKKRWIKGIVTSVGDPDGFRLYHTPGFVTFWKFRGIPQTRKGLVNRTISVRLAGIDAPEYGHFNKESQPFSQEALDWLKQMVSGKIVYCQLLKRDQYARAVAAVIIPRWFLPNFLTPRYGTSLADEMLRAGLATVYLGKDAVYGRSGMEVHLAIEAEAKEQRRGQWINGTDIESPAEYKRRHRSSSASSESALDTEAGSEEIMGDEESTEAERKGGSRLRRFWSKLMGHGP